MKNVFYLETSSIRYFIHKLSLPFFQLNCFTSALTIIELITNLEQDFEVRRRCLAGLIYNGIRIDWSLPEAVMCEAFPLIQIEEFRTKDLRRICFLIIGSATYGEFLIRERQEKLSHTSWYFKENDRLNNLTFTDASKFSIKEITNFLNDDNSHRIIPVEEPIEIQRRDDFLKLHEKYQEVNEGLTLLALSESYAIGLKASDMDSTSEKIYNSYNGKVKYYITAYTYYNINKMARGNESNVNDRVDLQHFLYLRKYKNIIMVSNDKLIKNICELFWPRQFIVPEKLPIA